MRAGASAEIIAAETGWPIEKVARYAGPPLAERAYIAERAQHVEVRRTGGPVLLADSVVLVLGDSDAEAVVWDALRRDDGRWIVTAALPSSTKRGTATWSYDAAGPNLHPLDESARWLMGVSDEPIIDFITETPVAVVTENDEEAEVVDVRPRLVAVPSIDDALDDVDDAAGEAEALETEPDALVEDSGQTTIAIPTGEPTRAAKKAKPKGRRASVPSWDEILFGANRGDDA